MTQASDLREINDELGKLFKPKRLTCPKCGGDFDMQQIRGKFQSHCTTITCWVWGPARTTRILAAKAFASGEIIGETKRRRTRG